MNCIECGWPLTAEDALKGHYCHDCMSRKNPIEWVEVK